VSLLVHLDEEGAVRAHRFERTWIRCRRRLDYDSAQEVLLGQVPVDAATGATLRTLHQLATAVRRRRRERGSLDFDLPEARVVLDEDGVPQDILKLEQLDSHRLVEDFMILANEVVARAAGSRRLPIPFRVHEPPTADRTEALREFLSPLGYVLPRDRIDPKSIQGVLDRAEGRPEEGLVSTVVLRSMARARYDAENRGHFGLASRAYTHFTSPIRRYPDLALHRVVVRSLIEGNPPPPRWSREKLEEMAAHSSERERLAQQAERDSVEMKKIEFMSRHLGDEFDGTISGVTSFGLFVLLDRYFVDGLIHVSALGDDYYAFVPEAYALVGKRSKRRFRLGDRIRVTVVRTDKEARRIDFVPAPVQGSP
jgi:ribonuclease R